MKRFLFSFLILANYSIALEKVETKVETNKNNQNIKEITVSILLSKDEILYKNSLYTTVNNPNVTLTPLITESTTSSIFDPSFKETKDGYQNDITFKFKAQKKDDSDIYDSTVHFFFNTNLKKEPVEKTININWKEVSKNNSNKINDQATGDSSNNAQLQTVKYASTDQNFLGIWISKITNFIYGITQKWKTKLESIFESTASRGLRFLVVLILGILLSLTPCIYPMIPITVGVLQSSENKSILRNFLMAFSYTLGISCTFAIFGLITALGSGIFGQLQSNAWIVLPLIFLLIYLGLSMFGLYEMYIPKFLQPKDTQVKKGSFISAFIFGVISGGVASPCLSPGLALVLAHVAKITQQANLINYLDGFLSLFIFGIGSSLPLLIIGTFSSSINFLPKAGLWMVEVKKLLGLMLLGMAFYYLEKFISWHILSWFIAIFMFAVGIYYFIDSKPYESGKLRIYKSIMGTLFIIAACLMAVQGYKAVYNLQNPEAISSIWATDYDQARQIAIKENKKLFVDFVTTHCAMCKAVEKKINPILQSKSNSFITVKVDGSNAANEPFAHLHKIIDIKGFPTLAIIDPVTEKPLKIWQGDIDTDFANELDRQK